MSLLAINSARRWSWALGIASVALPFALFLQQRYSFDKWASQQDGGVCGMPLLAALILCALLSFGLSLCALITALASYIELKRPRPGLRLLEVFLAGSIFIAGLIGFVAVSVASLWA